MNLTEINEWLARTTDQPAEELLPWLVGAIIAVACLVFAWFVLPRSNANVDEAIEDDRAGIFGNFTWLLAHVLPDLLPYKARRDLLRCGFLQPSAYDSYLALRNALVIGVTLTVGMWLVAVSEDDALVVRVLIVGALSLLIAYSLPRLYVNWRGDRAAEQTLLGLPDALDVIAMGLSGGLSVQAAVQRASQELAVAHPQLVAQLQIVCRQASAGTLEQALDRWAERIDLEEVTTLASMISHAGRTGSNVAVALRSYADALRLQRLQRAQERSNRVAIQMLFPTVLCLAPATYIILLAPPLLDLQKFRDQENKSGGLLSQPTKIGGAMPNPSTK